MIARATTARKTWGDEQTSGVNLDSVEGCRESRGEAIRRSLDADVDVALAAGIQGTPGFVIYNRESGAAGKLVGAHPYENFADALDQAREAWPTHETEDNDERSTIRRACVEP